MARPMGEDAEVMNQTLGPVWAGNCGVDEVDDEVMALKTPYSTP